MILASAPYLLASAALGRHLVYVASSETEGRLAGWVTVIDAATSTVLGTEVRVGVDPTSIAATRDGRLVCVTSDYEGALYLIETSSLAVSTVSLPTGSKPAVIVADDSRIYVADERSGYLSAYDIATRQRAGLPLPAGIPSGHRSMVLSPDGATLYLSADRILQAVDTATMTRTGSFPCVPPEICYGSPSLVLSPDSRRVYGLASAGIQVFDVSSRRLTGILYRTPAAGVGLVITPDGESLYALFQSGSVDPGHLRRFDLSTDGIGDAIPAGTYPTDLAISPDGKQLYVSDLVSRSILVIDRDKEREVARIPVSGEPRGIVVAPPPPSRHTATATASATRGSPTRTPTRTATGAATRTWTATVTQTPCSSCRTFLVPGDFIDIQPAINAAAPGDTVLVRPGVYVGPIDFRRKEVTVRSVAGPQVTTLRIRESFVIGPYGRLVGFTIVGRGSLNVIDSGSVIRGNVFEGMGIQGSAAAPIIEGNLFRKNAATVISLEGRSNARIVNNVFVDNGTAIRGSPFSTDMQVINNTFLRNTYAISTFASPTASGQTYANNILFQNENGLAVALAESLEKEPRWRNNLVFGNGVDYSGVAVRTGRDGNLSADPLLLDILAGNYRLRPDSPAVDAGDSRNAPNIDIDHYPRPFDGDGDGVAAFDLGAYELVPAAFPTHTPVTPPTPTPTRTVGPLPTTSFGPFPPGSGIFVDRANEGPEDGSPVRPYRTIQRALAAVRDITTIGVAAGVYQAPIQLLRGISLVGSGATLVTIEATGNGSAVRCADQSTLSGFRIRGPRTAASGSGLVSCEGGRSMTIESCVIEAVNESAIVFSESRATVRNSTLSVVGDENCACPVIRSSQEAPSIDNNRIDASASPSSAVFVDGVEAGGLTVRRNYIIGGVNVRQALGTNEISGNLINLPGNKSGGIGVSDSRDFGGILNNTVVGGNGISLSRSSASVINNIAAFGRSGLQGIGADSVLQNNLVFGNQVDFVGMTDPTGTNGNISADPLFAGASTGDFHLTCASPAIDRGRNLAAISVDLDGDRRPFNAHGYASPRTDIGADEHITANGAPFRTWYVPDDTATIQQAIDASSPCDRIFVRPGTYQERIRMQAKPLVLRSIEGPSQTRIEGEGVVVEIGANSELTGFTIVHTGSVPAPGVLVHGSGTLIRQNVLSGDSSAEGFTSIAGTRASPQLDGNLFRENRCAAAPEGAALVSFDAESAPLLVNNLFHSNDCDAIRLPTTSAAAVINNTLVANRTGILLDGTQEPARGLQHNNILAGNCVAQQAQILTTQWRHNLLFDNHQDYLGVPDRTGISGNLRIDPGFADLDGGDLRLLPGSPAVDAGIAERAPRRDRRGVVRPQDGNGDGTAVVDIGAYELIPARCPGDCDGDGHTSQQEIAFGIASLFSGTDPCSFDANSDGHVAAADLMWVLHETLGGCQASVPSSSSGSAPAFGRRDLPSTPPPSVPIRRCATPNSRESRAPIHSYAQANEQRQPEVR